MSGELEIAGNATTSEPHLVFTGSYCESLFYRFKVKNEGFDVDAFAKAVGIPDDKREARATVTCTSLNQSSDYHLHVSWRLRKMVSFNIDFIRGSVPHEKNEREPFAEQFMNWIQPFFIEKTVDTEIQGDFTYPADRWEPRFSLPLKANIGPNESEAEIDGISFVVPSRPDGIHKVWLTSEAASIFLHTAASRLSDFGAFDVKKDITTFTGVLNTILKEKRL